MMRLENLRIYAYLFVLGKRERQKVILMTTAQIDVILLYLFGVTKVGLSGYLTVDGLRRFSK
jgi:hypothetical protein